MDQKFFQLPEEKQQRIIKAGFRVFSENSYRKSPMNEIAAEAGISKSLLFHYFHNKKELYLFLWDQAAQISINYLNKYHCYDSGDLFELMERGMNAKLQIIRLFPHMAAFIVKAFYERDPEVSGEIQASYENYFRMKASNVLKSVNADDFMPGLDLSMMYRNMYWASEGYLWEMAQKGEMDFEQMEEDFRKLLDFWKSVYGRPQP